MSFFSRKESSGCLGVLAPLGLKVTEYKFLIRAFEFSTGNLVARADSV